ncbi:GNAT family N-acetyltransferase [Phenylobacterium deserti]|uniref:GNAT family N-acetyltransferase n=1 Tax=Phenylobacterium deserti TaxID=1914756 RepID=A0A328ATU4_9CAUL|nr:GNAT family N-acetyltransferase [Phenylobacterium deserti]RAK58027.1 GNAT family N-acetyltransferase [Phenylobacterium deserti]
MQETVIRRAGPADAEALSRIASATFTQTFGHLYPPEDLSNFLAQSYSVASMQVDLADPGKGAWLVEATGEVIGYAQAGPCGLPHPQVTAACGELKRFYLLQGRQGDGVGGRLFEAVMAWLQADGPRTVWIGVWSENFGAQRFYERRGFVKVGDYGFPVGDTVDHEFILRRGAETFSNDTAPKAKRRHDLA